MADSLISQLNAAGVSCRALRSWCACHDSGGHSDLCETCYLGDPAECDAQVIEILVKRLVNEAGHVDEALDQRDYWKRVADRICNLVMERSRETDDES